MSQKDGENGQLGDTLRKVRLAEPPARLKERVISAARQVWIEGSPQVLWQVFARRMAALAAAAVLVVALADLLSDHASARWRSGGHTRAIKELASLDALLETPYGLRVGHPAIARYRRSGADASKLIEYIEAVGRILNETHQGRASDRAAPIKGGSRLFPSRFRSDWYS